MPHSLRIAGLLIIGSLSATPAWGQTASPSADDLFRQSLERRADCLSHYRFGSVHFLINAPSQHQTLSPGDDLLIQGTVQNTNDYLLTQGRILIRILREGNNNVAQNWHPYLTEFWLPDDYQISAGETKPFDTTWRLPARSPQGTYRVELFFLAGQRYVMAGIPYAPAAAGATFVFQVLDGGQPAAVSFNRDSVLLAGAAFPLRAVPNSYPAAAPLSINVNLEAEAPATVPVRLRTALYTWSDSDQGQPLQETIETKLVVPGTPLPLSWPWPSPQPGVHELVIQATPYDSSILPSLIKIRFPIAGHTPRIIFSGVAGFVDNNAIVATCVVNGTFGPGQGHTQTHIQQGNTIIAQAATAVAGDDLTTTLIRLPISNLAQPITVQALATDANGQVTDQHAVEYTQPLLPVASAHRPASNLRWQLTAAVGTVTVLGFIIWVWYARKKQRRFW